MEYKPERIIYRSRSPILEPTEDYENYGYKWGVVFACGAIVKDDTLFVYYGGSDKTVNIAQESLPLFLDQLKYTGSTSLKVYD